MGIKEMLYREDFYNILRDTIIKYARVVLGKNICCEYTPFEGSEPWLVNRLLGFVSRSPVPSGVGVYMKSEYNIRGSFFKNLIGKVAVYIITKHPEIGSSRIVYVSSGVFKPNVFIVPQNRSIRFYDYETMKVDCIVKTGFTNTYFDNQTSFRKANHYDFLNPMLMSGEDWFQESILKGHPLARTTDTSLFEKGKEAAFQYLKSLATDTLEWKPIKEYVSLLKEELLVKIDRAKKSKSIIETEAAIRLIEKASALELKYNQDIPTCISHGDFQSGNIWIEPTGKTLVYDWETVGRRSVWYDSATLYYSLRRAFGWSKMLEDKTTDGLYKCIPDTVKIEMDRKTIIGVVLLEDILFYLDDMLELPDNWGSEIFDKFIRVIKELNFE